MTKKYTLQESFDIAVQAVMKQGKGSTDGTVCLYRSGDGLKCAIGHLIDDKHYKKKFEYTNIEEGPDIIDAVRKSGHKELSENTDLMYRLQKAHDGVDPDLNPSKKQFREEFEKEAKQIAKEYNLEWNLNKDLTLKKKR